jgi:hypothetical protein
MYKPLMTLYLKLLNAIRPPGLSGVAGAPGSLAPRFQAVGRPLQNRPCPAYTSILGKSARMIKENFTLRY